MEENEFMVDKSTQIEPHELPTGCSTPNCSRNTRRSVLKYPHNGSSCQDLSDSVVKFSIQDYSEQKLSEIRNRMLPYAEEAEETNKDLSIEKINTPKRLSKPSVSFSNIHKYVEIPDDQDITEEEMEEDEQDSLTAIEESSIEKIALSELATASGGLTKDSKEILRSSFQGVADEIVSAVIMEAVNVQLKISSMEIEGISDENIETSTVTQIDTEDEERPHPIYNITLKDLARKSSTPISSNLIEVQVQTEQFSRSPAEFRNTYETDESTVLRYISSIALDVIDFSNENEILKHISTLHSRISSPKGELSKQNAEFSDEKSNTSITSESSDDNRVVTASKRTSVKVNAPKHQITPEENSIGMSKLISPRDFFDENDNANDFNTESDEQSKISRPQYNLTEANLADNMPIDVSSFFSERQVKQPPDSHLLDTKALRDNLAEDTLADNVQIEVPTVFSEKPGVYQPDSRTSDTRTLRTSFADDTLADNVQIEVPSIFSEKPGVYHPDSRTSDTKTLRSSLVDDTLADNIQIEVSSVFSEKPIIYDPDSRIQDSITLSNELKYKELLRIIDEERVQKFMNDNKTEEAEENLIDVLTFDHPQSIDDETNTEIRTSSWKYDGMIQPEFVEPVSSSMKPYALTFEDEEIEADRTEVSTKSSEQREYATREYILDKLARAEGRRRPISFSFDQPMGSDVSRSSGILSNSLEIPGYTNVVTSSRNLQRILDGRYFSLNEVHVFWDQMKKECLFIRSLFLFLLYYLIYLTLYCGLVHKCVC
ncbi:hypothetical protein WA026_009787 [Henosepilachna vigintioctopunctata]|uniref:Uncharacterized protein n=1 Tax=Henosepilachna vigintioctopunctata TaxID=420089 RepID=A0AAW1TQ87_9CUCU